MDLDLWRERLISGLMGAVIVAGVFATVLGARCVAEFPDAVQPDGGAHDR